MRKRIFNWQGERFAYLWLEAEGGQSLERQSEALFSRAAAELDPLGLSIAKNVVRTRLFGRTRQARERAQRRAGKGPHRAGSRRRIKLHLAGAFALGGRCGA